MTNTDSSVSRDLPAISWKLNSTKIVKGLVALLMVSLILFTAFNIFIGPSPDGFFSMFLDSQEGLNERSCESRNQSDLYRARQRLPKPSSYLVSRLRKYEALQKRCGPNTEDYKKTIEILKLGKKIANTFNASNSDCKYVIWTPVGGLGNRMLTLASTFLYALLMNRVLFIDNGNTMPILFCEPFPEVSWLLPSDFPIGHFKSLDQYSPNSYLEISRDRSRIMPPFVYIHMFFDNSHIEKIPFCDHDQVLLNDVPWMLIKSNLYYVPSLFSIPSFQQELDNLFPEKETVFHHLGRYLFNPSNTVWRVITKYYDSYLAKSNETIGFQIRLVQGGVNGFPNLDQILSCTRKENLLPEINKTKTLIEENPDHKGKTKVVLITSLFTNHYKEMKKMYSKYATITRERVEIYQPSHEGRQRKGNKAHDSKALAEIFLLSMSDKLVTTAWSTFGYVAQSLGGLRPWILYSPDNGRVPNPPCQKKLKKKKNPVNSIVTCIEEHNPKEHHFLKMSTSSEPKASPLKKNNRHSSSLADLEYWYSKDPQAQALKKVVKKLRLQSLSTSASNTPPSETEAESESDTQSNRSFSAASVHDSTALLSDELLLNVFSKLSKSQLISNSLVCKRWGRLSGKLVRKLRLLDWEFIQSGRAIHRFPNLIDVDMVQCCIKSSRNSSILFNSKWISVNLVSSMVLGLGFLRKDDILDSWMIDRGVRILAEGCGNLGSVSLINVSEQGLNCLSEECEMLQEIELHCCDDLTLKGVSGFKNLQIFRLIGYINGIYQTSISDIGLTILAQGCRRLVKLELVGCEGSFDGIKAIGQCCQMLEELSLCDHRMEGGWLAALSYCWNLKTLKLQSCKNVDASPGPEEHLGCCRALEKLHLQRCHVHEKQGIRALFIVCGAVRELVLDNCWGLDNNTLAVASICRNIRMLSLEGCSLLTTQGLEMVVHTWKQLTQLKVTSCNNIKDSEITQELATLFTVLKELKWRPDTKSLLSSALEGTGVGQKGGKTFRWK